MMNHVAYSTPEGELAAISYGLRTAGSPGMIMWERLSGQRQGESDTTGTRLPHTLLVHGDNSASISIAKSGKNPTMRHMGRTHGVSLSWISNEIKCKRFDLGYIHASDMATDIFTKFYTKENATRGGRCAASSGYMPETIGKQRWVHQAAATSPLWNE